MRWPSCLRLVFGLALLPVLAGRAAEPATAVVQWRMFEGTLRHPAPPADPLRDAVLETEFTAPDGAVRRFFGFHEDGGLWRFRFAPDQPGGWRYMARFADGRAAVSGRFECVPAPAGAPAPLVRWRDNPIWFARAGASAPLLVRGFHVGDGFFARNLPTERRAAFYAWARGEGHHLLSVASHYLNRDAPGRGRGWDTPRLWDAAARTVRPEEYARAEALLTEAGEQGLYIFPFAGFIGRASDAPATPEDRDAYFRYTVARFAPFWNVLFNIAGPEPLWFPGGYRPPLDYAEINRLGGLLRRLDPFDRLRSVHNAEGDDPFRFLGWPTFSTLQGGPVEKTADFRALHHWVFRNHTLDRPLYAQEVLWPGNSLHAPLTPDEVRRKALVLLFGGVGAINFADMDGDSSTGYSGTLDPAQRRPEHHVAIRAAWDFFETIPFGPLRPRWGGGLAGVWLADGQREFWAYFPSPRDSGLPAGTGPGWRGEWRDPQGRLPPVKFLLAEQKRLAPPPDFRDDAVLHLLPPASP